MAATCTSVFQDGSIIATSGDAVFQRGSSMTTPRSTMNHDEGSETSR
jgi:hypothetical protein